jgi:hypothetical protein
MIKLLYSIMLMQLNEIDGIIQKITTIQVNSDLKYILTLNYSLVYIVLCEYK